MSATTVPVENPLAAVLAVRRRALWSAVRETTPVMAGFVPFAVVLGASVAAAPVDHLAGWVLSGLVWSGSGQLATMTAITAGGSALAAVVAGLLVNARLLVFGAILAPRFRSQPPLFRWLAPGLIIDPSFALAMSHEDEQDPAWFRVYWLACGAVIAVMWLGGVAVGIVAGDVLTRSFGLEDVIPLVYVGMLVPSLVARPAVAAALVGGAVTLATGSLPGGLGLVLGALAGAAAGAGVERAGGPRAGR